MAVMTPDLQEGWRPRQPQQNYYEVT